MAEKQNGYVAQKRDKEAGHIYFYGDVEHCELLINHHRRKLVKATLVIGDERVFTESEVKPLLEIAKAIGQKPYHPTASVNALDAEALKKALSALGVSLDPA